MSSAPNNTAENEADGGIQAVGELLKASRLRSGQELRDIAQTLRIRYRFLEAIEDGDVTGLPGQTYAIGFVRAYAEHLGLDGAEVVRRFKGGVAEAKKKDALVFPSPIAESGIPGGAILFVGLVVAALGYGIWYFNTTDDVVIDELVAPVPERLAEGTPAPTPDAAPAPEPVAEPAAEPVAPEQAPEAISGAMPDPAPAEAAVVEATETGATEAPAEPAAQPMPDPAPAPAAGVPAEIAPAVDAEAPAPVSEPAPAIESAPTPEPTPAPEVAEIPAPAPEPAPETVEEPAPTAAPEAEAETQAATSPTAAAATPEDTASRIEIRARINSWIQVRDDDAGRLLFTRLLRAGDSYHVPDRTGLRLLTGNAGALEILVDGELVPAIGGEGQVRRDVALDPDRLQAGTAVLDN